MKKALKFLKSPFYLREIGNGYYLKITNFHNIVMVAMIIACILIMVFS